MSLIQWNIENKHTPKIFNFSRSHGMLKEERTYQKDIQIVRARVPNTTKTFGSHLNHFFPSYSELEE
jgi:hypothetical protein